MSFSAWGGDPAKPFDEPRTIHGSQLIEDDESVLALKTTTEPKGIGMPTRRQRSHEERIQVSVELVRRDDKTWARLPNVPATSGLKGNQVHVAACGRPLSPTTIRFHRTRSG